MNYASEVETEYWDDDGGVEWAEMDARLQREGMVLERYQPVSLGARL
jgi:hypothetical protein